MKKTKNILWGLAFITIGVLLSLKVLEVITFDIFFKGWWTLLIIIPSFIGLFDDHDKTANLIGILVGVILLLGVNDIINLKYVWKLFIPVILIMIGVSCIVKNTIMNKIKNKVKTQSDSKYVATFSGEKINVGKSEFKGAKAEAIFGGLEIDLRDAKITDDVILDVTALFGGVDLLVRDDVKVVVTSSSIFGGVTNKSRGEHVTEKSKTLYINATCAFGGVEVK